MDWHRRWGGAAEEGEDRDRMLLCRVWMLLVIKLQREMEFINCCTCIINVVVCPWSWKKQGDSPWTLILLTLVKKKKGHQWEGWHPFKGLCAYMDDYLDFIGFHFQESAPIRAIVIYSRVWAVDSFSFYLWEKQKHNSKSVRNGLNGITTIIFARLHFVRMAHCQNSRPVWYIITDIYPWLKTLLLPETLQMSTSAHALQAKVDAW